MGQKTVNTMNLVYGKHPNTINIKLHLSSPIFKLTRNRFSFHNNITRMTIIVPYALVCFLLWQSLIIPLVGIHGFQFDRHADRGVAPFCKNTLFMIRTRIKGNSNVEALFPQAAVLLCDVQPRARPNDNATNNIRKGPFSLARWNRLLVSSSEQRRQEHHWEDRSKNERVWVGPLWNNRHRRIQRMEYEEDTAIRKWQRRIRRPRAHQRTNGTNNGIANSRNTEIKLKVSDPVNYRRGLF